MNKARKTYKLKNTKYTHSKKPLRLKSMPKKHEVTSLEKAKLKKTINDLDLQTIDKLFKTKRGTSTNSNR